jgi:predicted DNA-binding transcriptional regulator AlpA
MPDPTPTQLLTRKELSTRWRVSSETIKRREKAGLLPSLKLGKSVRYRLSDIERIESEAEVAR